MQVKNLSFVEKHVEKVAGGVALLIASLVLYLFVFGSPYRVTLASTGQVVTPDTICEPLNAATDRLEAALNDDSSPLPPIVVEHYADDFQKRVDRAKTANANLEAPFGPAGLDAKVWREKRQ